MYPQIHLFGLHLPSYVAMLVAAVLVCHWLGPLAAERLEGIPRWKTRSILILLGVAAFAGGRAHFVWNSWSLAGYANRPGEILAFWRGLHAGGALIALAIALPIVVRVHGVAVGRFVDALSPPIAIGIAVARIGCFLQGCCFGTIAEVPWAVRFPAGSPVANFQASARIIARGAEWSSAVHPLQLYFASGALIAALAGLWVHGRRTYPGRVALTVAAVYLSSSALAETLRAPYYPQFYFWGSRMQFEWIAIALALIAVVALACAEIVEGWAVGKRALDDRKQATS